MPLITDIGDPVHAFTSGGTSERVVNELQKFEAAVNDLTAYGGGDHPEYALGAMLEALEYSFRDEYNETFVPMSYNSEMIVITDATSKEETLEMDVIEKAQEQDVSIHFILVRGVSSYGIYRNIARETGGTVYSADQSTWSILRFLEPESETKRRKRSAPSGDFSVHVSVFTHTLRVSILTVRLSTGRAYITAPDKTLETASIENNVMIYIKSRPKPGIYLFSIGDALDEDIVEQDISLDISFFYIDTNSAKSSRSPPPACKDLLYIK